MTPLLVFFTFVFGVIFSGARKTKRNITSYEVDAEGLKEIFPDIDKSRKICRYYFSGDLDSPKICENEFECKDCSVHKRFSHMTLFTEESYFCVKKIREVDFSPCLFYHRGHTCLSIGKNGNVLIGIDSFILKTLGEKADRIALPEQGDFIEANEIAFSLISGEDYFPILAPVSGEVTRLNEKIRDDIRTNKAFVWLCIVKPFDLESDLQSLLLGKEAEEWMNFELNAFREMLFKGREFAADGGNIDFSHLNFDREEFIENFLLSYKKKAE